MRLSHPIGYTIGSLMLLKSLLVFAIYPLGGWTAAAFGLAVWGLVDLIVAVGALRRLPLFDFACVAIALGGCFLTYSVLGSSPAPKWLHLIILGVNAAVVALGAYGFLRLRRS